MMPAVLFRATVLLLFLDKWNKREKLSPRGSGKLSAHISYFLTPQQLFQQLILSHFMICIFLTCKASFSVSSHFKCDCKKYVYKEHNFKSVNPLSWLSIHSEHWHTLSHHSKQSAENHNVCSSCKKNRF